MTDAVNCCAIQVDTANHWNKQKAKKKKTNAQNGNCPDLNRPRFHAIFIEWQKYDRYDVQMRIWHYKGRPATQIHVKSEDK